jgi:hypothetical protein
MMAVSGRSITAAVLAMLLTTSGVRAADKLAPNDIQSTFFNGQPFTASTPSDLKFKMTFNPDGKMRRQPIGKGTKGTGNWKLSKDGFCTTWNAATIANCFTVVSAGDNKWSVMRGATVQANWSK